MFDPFKTTRRAATRRLRKTASRSLKTLWGTPAAKAKPAKPKSASSKPKPKAKPARPAGAARKPGRQGGHAAPAADRDGAHHQHAARRQFRPRHL